MVIDDAGGQHETLPIDCFACGAKVIADRRDTSTLDGKCPGSRRMPQPIAQNDIANHGIEHRLAMKITRQEGYHAGVER